MNDVYSMLGAAAHALGIDRCADMNTPAGIIAVALVSVGAILLGANVAILVASFTNHQNIAKRIMKFFSYVIWMFRLGGGDGYEGDHRRA
jgi:hypothetical protein